VAIAGATASSLALSQAQVGKAITVTASYTDSQGTAESLTSSASAAILNLNDAPTGGVTFSGTAKQGQTLTAVNTLADIDGMGTVSYQWKAGGVAIAGATASTLALGQAQVGKAITVTASYTDSQGTAESVTSSASAAVIALDTTAPTVIAFAPADEAAGVASSSNIVLTFSEAVVKGTGAVVLKTAAGTVIASYDVATSTNLTLSSDKTTLTMNPNSDLAFSTAYTVELAAGTFKDMVGNLYAGTTSYNFSTIGTTYTGTAGADSLTGDVGNDTLNALAGNDTLNGGAGADTLTGGDGSDSYYVDNIGDTVTETNAVASTGGTDLVYSYLAAYTLGGNVENGRILAAGTATLTGNGLNNVLYAGAGSNVLDGGAGTDTVSYQYATAAVTASLAVTTSAQPTGGSGSDTIKNLENFTGSSYADSLMGSIGNNTLNGGSGNDLLNGGAGKDVLIGGLGADTLTGGTGADRFDFNALSELGLTSTTRDTITDFRASEADKIDLQGVDANTALAGDQAFSFLGALTAFTGDATGKLRFDATAHILYGSTDADTAAEFAIVLTGVSSLTASSLVL
jgi:Ca2+-binding RTX toxin-like protein